MLDYMVIWTAGHRVRTAQTPPVEVFRTSGAAWSGASRAAHGERLEPMSNRRVPSLKEAVQAAEEWYASEDFWRNKDAPVAPPAIVNFFMDSDDRRIDDFPPLLAHCDLGDRTYDLRELFSVLGTAWSAINGAVQAFNDPACDLKENHEYTFFAREIGHVMRRGGIHVFLCARMRNELRQSMDDDTEAERGGDPPPGGHRW